MNGNDEEETPLESVQHIYLSTACFHEEHLECRKICRFCPARCTCGCHLGDIDLDSEDAAE